ncbi:MAG: copper homeostasis periplasmic binding protein CopC [Opitutales bacterium]
MKNIKKTRPGRRALLTGLLLLAGTTGAWAHAFLDHADPKVGSTVSPAPTVVKLWFTEDLEPAFSKLTVSDAQGKEVDKKDAHVDDKNKALFIVSLPAGLPAGAYTVNWHAVASDTHKTQGTFKFTVK